MCGRKRCQPGIGCAVVVRNSPIATFATGNYEMTTINYNNAVIFGAGQVGMTLMEQLVQQGVSVTLVSRRGSAGEPLPVGATIVAGDVNDPATVAPATSAPVPLSGGPWAWTLTPGVHAMIRPVRERVSGRVALPDPAEGPTGSVGPR